MSVTHNLTDPGFTYAGVIACGSAHAPFAETIGAGYLHLPSRCIVACGKVKVGRCLDIPLGEAIRQARAAGAFTDPVDLAVALWWPEGWEGDALYSPPHSDINGSLRSGTTVLAQSSDASAAFERMTSRPADPEAVSLRISGSYLPHGDQTVYWFAIATPVPTLKIPPPLKPIEPVRRIPPGS